MSVLAVLGALVVGFMVGRRRKRVTVAYGDAFAGESPWAWQRKAQETIAAIVGSARTETP